MTTKAAYTEIPSNRRLVKPPISAISARSFSRFLAIRLILDYRIGAHHLGNDGSPPPPPDEPTHLFVYGTMLRGKRNHGRLIRIGAVYVADTKTRSEFEMSVKPTTRGQIAPIAIPGGRWAICGELYRTTMDGLLTVDPYEGHPDVYNRQQVKLSDGQTAWAYVYDHYIDHIDLRWIEEVADGVLRFDGP